MESDYFKNTEFYETIFKSCPTSKLWEDFADPEVEMKFDKDSFREYFNISQQPSAEEYLLSYLIWCFIKEYSIKPIDNRKQALERGVKSRDLSKDNKGTIIEPQEKQAEYLLKDPDYMINNVINNSKEVLLEMYSFILNQKYGNGYNAAKKILSSGAFNDLSKSPDFKHFVSTMPRTKDNLLFSIYEFLRYVLESFYSKIAGEYAASSRRKSFLATQSFVQKFKRNIVDMENMSAFKNTIKDWKDPGKSFIKSLPSFS
jgi:hypothetical protein